MKVLKGFCYCVTAATETIITDDNGLNLTVKAGEQGYFVASTDEVSETGTCTIVQVRGNFNMPTTEGGGGPVDYVYMLDNSGAYHGEIPLSTATVYWNDFSAHGIQPHACNVVDGPLTGNITDYTQITNYDALNVGSWNVNWGSLNTNYEPLVGLFENKNITTFEHNLRNLQNGTNMFKGCTNLTKFVGDMPRLEVVVNMFKDCTSLESFEGDLSGVVYGYSGLGSESMFAGCTSLKHFKSNLTNFNNGLQDFIDYDVIQNLETFDANMNNITNMRGAFEGNTRLKSFKGDMPHLVSDQGYMRMFKDCTSLESFEGSLSGIQTYPSSIGWGDGIFNGCTSLRHFKSDLSRIGNDGRDGAWLGTLLGYARIDSIGEEGPIVCLLETWDADLSNATNGRYAFINVDNQYTVSNLRSFKGDLGNLQDAEAMFADQCIHLTNFETTSLHSLVDAKEMFKGCKLSKASVENIINVIRDFSVEPACCVQDHNITIGVDATEVSISDINNVYMPALTAKGWTVTWERN